MADLLIRRRHRVARSDAPALTAAASILMPSRMLRLNNYPWQSEAWNFYREGVGAFKYGMLWHAQTMSRVRLTAAVAVPGGEEPQPVTDGPAAELIAQFFGGPAGQSQYMYDMDIQLEVPGEGYVVAQPDGESGDPNAKRWAVRSNTELQVTSGRVRINGARGRSVDVWRVEVDEGVWEPLPYETLVFRQWIPDQEKHWRADSPTRGALRTLRIIDLLERRIMAMAVSRLASNGILFYPQEVTFPPKPGFEKAADPFTAEWLDIAGKTIDNPGSALAAIPMPVKVPQQYIKDFVHMDFANPFDERLMEILRMEYDNLATAMNMPKEVVTGMGSTSHWNAWTLDEQGIETHIKPPAEVICQGVTKGWLHPALLAEGQPTSTADGELICWYDTSELDVPPDRSQAADAAFDRQVITATAYRNAKGFSEADTPTKSELREQLLVQLAKDPTAAPAAIEELTGSPVAGVTTGPGGVEETQPAPAAGPPRTPAQPSPPSAG